MGIDAELEGRRFRMCPAVEIVALSDPRPSHHKHEQKSREMQQGESETESFLFQ